MGPLWICKGDLYKTFPAENVTFCKGDLFSLKGLVKVTVISPFLNLKGLVSNTFKLSKVHFCAV